MEVWQPVFVQHSLADGGREFLPILFDVVDRIVFKCRGEFQVFGIVALQATDVRHTDAPCQKRVFAVTFVDAAPIWITADVDDGGAIDQPFVFALEVWILMPAIVDGAGFVRDGRRNFVDQLSVPGGSHRDRDREHGGRSIPPDAVQTLVPLVGLDAKTLDVRRAMVQQHRLFLQRQP